MTAEAEKMFTEAVNGAFGGKGEQPRLARPGGVMAKRVKSVFLMADVSGSMTHNAKIQSLNNAMKDALPAMQKAAEQHPHIEVMVRVLAFGDTAEWINRDPIPLAQFCWTPLGAEGQTAMGRACSTVAECLRTMTQETNIATPAIILVSDGQPTDDFHAGLNDLMSTVLGRKAVRLAIAIGKDADENVLGEFIGNPDLPVFHANNPEMLAHYIRFASTLAVVGASTAGGSLSATASTAPSAATAPTVW